MRADTLRAFFEDRVSAAALDAELRGAWRQSSSDSFQLLMSDLSEDYSVTPEHLVKLCEAVLAMQLDPEALRAVGFGLIASGHFAWDGDTPDGERVASTLNDWASPEVNFRLDLGTVAKFRLRLLTGEDSFTRADLSGLRKGRRDDWKCKP